MKKILFIAALILCIMPAHAVLKEKSLARTLGVLKLELRSKYIKQKENMLRYETTSEQQHELLVDYMKQSEQIGLMLYSQNQDFTFDVAYTCQEATNLYRKLTKTNVPYDQIRIRIQSEVARYDSLIYSLQQLPPRVERAANSYNAADSALMSLNDTAKAVHHHHHADDEPYMLTEEEIKDREECLIYSKALRNNLLRILNKILEDKQYYDHVSDKVERLNDYAMQKYKTLQQSIFVNGGSNYFKLLKRLPQLWIMIKYDFTDKYIPFDSQERHFSEWRGPTVIFTSVFMIVYMLLAALVAFLLIKGIPKLLFKVIKPSEKKVYKALSLLKSEHYKKKEHAIAAALGILIFAIAVWIIRQNLNRNLIIMATGLMVMMAWLIEVVYVSLIIRLNADQIKHGEKAYGPFILMAFIVILFRIVLIPNNLVNIIYPPILLVFTIWQIVQTNKVNKNIPLTDKVYCGISTFAMLASCIISWCGYTLLAVQIMIWWIFQLAAIQTITCFYDLMELYEVRILKRKILRKIKEHELAEHDADIILHMKAGNYIQYTWVYDFVNRAFVPILAVCSILFSILWAAGVFEMTETCKHIFNYPFIQEKDIVEVSLRKLCLVIACFFIFRYVNYATRSFYFHFQKSINEDGKAFNKTLAKNIISILVWGTYFLLSLVILKVPKSGISVVGAGLATGMGFAMKDLLENFFYGISLMTGRVRVGDYIECDGITGKVESITYQSTQIITLDGSVIAFLNTALFSKNFKNLTRNHQYELIKIPVGVAYGTDVDKVRRLLIEGITPLCEQTADGRDIVSQKHGLSVAFSDFGDNSVDLLLVCWVLVDQKISFTSKAKETIYNILNKNKIEIPFPQQDIYIRKFDN